MYVYIYIYIRPAALQVAADERAEVLRVVELLLRPKRCVYIYIYRERERSYTERERELSHMDERVEVLRAVGALLLRAIMPVPRSGCFVTKAIGTRLAILGIMIS